MLDFSKVATRQPIEARDPWGIGTLVLRRPDAQIFTRAVSARTTSGAAATRAALAQISGAVAGDPLADIDVGRMIADQQEARLACAHLLVAGWSGYDTPYSVEARDALFNSIDLVPDGAAYEGMTEGGALRDFVLQAARDGAAAQDAAALAEKKSSPSGGGGDAPTAPSPPTEKKRRRAKTR